MPSGRCIFKQRDVTRALRAAAAAGVKVERYEIDKDGKIVVVTGAGIAAPPETNEWDGVK